MAINKFKAIILNDAIRELTEFRESLASIDAMVGLVVDILAAIRDECEITAEFIWNGSDFSSAIKKYDLANIMSTFDKASAIIADHFGIETP